MKALQFRNKLSLINLPKPSRADDESLVKILKAGICNTDIEILKGYMNFEGILGHEFVGIVEECSDKRLLNKRVLGKST